MNNISAVMQELLESFFLYKMQTHWTACPAIVVSVENISQQRIDVQPAVYRVYGNEAEEEPVILNVPIIFPASSKSSITFPISVGDTVLLVFSKPSLDVFKAGDGEPDIPSNWKQFDYNDAIAIPGLFPFANSVNDSGKYNNGHSTSSIKITNNIGEATEAAIEIKDDGSVSMSNALANVELGATGEISMVTGTTSFLATPTSLVITSPNVIINGIDFSTHTHGGVTPGSGFTTPPV